METLWQQQYGGYVFYISNSTVVEWTFFNGFLIKYSCACVGVNKLSDLTTCTVQIQSRYGRCSNMDIYQKVQWFHLHNLPLCLHRTTVKQGAAVAQWLRYCASNRKVAGSIPDVFIGIFHWHNPSDRAMALGSTRHLTEMSASWYYQSFLFAN